VSFAENNVLYQEITSNKEAKMKERILFPLILMVLLLSGCAVIPGRGNAITETREVSNFQEVSFSAFGGLTITQGEQESLTIEAPRDIMARIETEVSGGTLYIRFDEEGFLPFPLPPRIVYNLTMREISGLDHSGAGSIHAPSIETDRLELVLSGAGGVTIDSLSAQTLEVRLNGAGGIELAGQVTEQDVTISGGGAYSAGDLESQRATVNSSGVGSSTVWATDSLDVTISGVGRVEYYGSPRVSQTVSGVGSVRSLGPH
jgi:hypothetical protein